MSKLSAQIDARILNTMLINLLIKVYGHTENLDLKLEAARRAGETSLDRHMPAKTLHTPLLLALP